MRKLYIGLLIIVSLFLLSSVSFAEPSVSFTAENVYWYDAEKLAVEGYFYNNGTKIINGITYFELSVYYYNPRTRQYQWLGQGIWDNNRKLLNVYLQPGDVHYLTFYLDTEGYPNFVDWRYKWYAQYNYIK